MPDYAAQAVVSRDGPPIAGLGSEALEVCVKAPPRPLSFLGTSYGETERALRATFGPFPIQLNRQEHEQVLAGMAAVGGTPYRQLLELVRTHDQIEVRYV